jgi:hypothetical protein
MRPYKCTDLSGQTVDLDNPETYKHLPTDLEELRNLMLREIGYYHCYVKYWHKDIFKGEEKFKSGDAQIKRVKKLIKNFTENEGDNRNNVIWCQEQIYLFQDETENMC